jgi:MoaA/NifB/PqqE/SkfB family radical SAM enzyme
MPVSVFNIDIEPTNRCNAHCYFCPRDQTPHQGLMTPEVFDQALRRVVEFDELNKERFQAHIKVNLCGLGEPLLNRHAPEFVRRIREAGFECSVSSNASLLDAARSQALLDAGVQGIEINVGEEGDDYEEIYGLPFKKTCDNVVRFAEMAGDRCQVRVVLVNHRRDPAHIRKMTQFWRARGIEHFLPFDVMNRGGALFVDEMQYDKIPQHAEAAERLEALPRHPVCSAPFLLLFIGYDGNYYLCCSDWKKEVPLGTVFDASLASIMSAKLEHATTRMPICKACNHDPVNRLTDKLRGVAEGTDHGRVSVEQFVGEMTGASDIAREIADELSTFAPATTRRRRIPLSVEADHAHL